MNNIPTELATALVEAQRRGDRFAESKVIVDIARFAYPQKGANQNCGKTVLSRFLEKVVFGASECWFWRGARHKLGYGLMKALGESKAHRVSYRLFRGELEPGLDVLHKCDVRNCVNPDHLFTGTQLDNVRDMDAKGRRRSTPRHGEANPQSKLTAADVAEMRRIRAELGWPYWRIAEQFGVVTMTAQRAIVGTSWRQQ